MPPAGPAEGDSDEFGQGSSGASGVAIGESLVEAQARAEEELVNARQENAYLAERIEELEAELGRLRAGRKGCWGTPTWPKWSSAYAMNAWR